MNHHMNPVKTGVALAKVVGGLHLIWAVLVWLGSAQAIVDFSMWAHMVGTPVTVKAFNLSAAVTLVIVTTVMGYVIGNVYARLWNRVHRS